MNHLYPVVYSYRTSRTRELELSIESLKNLKEWNGKIYIIGNEPDLKADYTYLPVKYSWGKESGVRSNDEICAYLTAADFLDEFIAMADDIFLLKPWSLEYQNKGTLESHIKLRKYRDSYTNQLINTQKFLQSHGKPTLSYEMHIPFLMNAESLKISAPLIKSSKPMLVRSLIGNWYNLESKQAIDPKNQPITDETIIYSSDDRKFIYENIKEHLK
jgi:hypothetical protein